MTILMPKKFVLNCHECGGDNVVIVSDIWMYPSSSGADVYIECQDCKAKEQITEIY